MFVAPIASAGPEKPQQTQLKLPLAGRFAIDMWFVIEMLMS